MKSIYDNDKVKTMALNGSVGPQLHKSIYDNDKVKTLAGNSTVNPPKSKSIYDNDKVKALAENQLVKREKNISQNWLTKGASNAPSRQNTSMQESNMKTIGNDELGNGFKRVGLGGSSIVNKTIGSVPYIAESAVQASKDFNTNMGNKNYRSALWDSFNQNSKAGEELRKAGRTVYPNLDNALIETKKAHNKDKVLKENSVSTPVTLSGLGYDFMKRGNEQGKKALEGLSPTAQFLGGTALSMGQNIATLPLAFAHPTAPLAAMGAIAAADKSLELAEKGVGAGEALKRGAVTGGIEALTEKMPLENLFKIAKGAGGKTFLKNILKQSGIEGTEESVSYFLNFIADKVAKDPDAEFSMEELLQSAAGGALSGGLMAGPATYIGNFKGNDNVNEEGLFKNTDTNNYRTKKRTASIDELQKMQTSKMETVPIDKLTQSDSSVNNQYIQNDKKNSHFGVINNTSAFKVASRTKRILNNMGESIGVSFVFDEHIEGKNGYFNPNENCIHIAMDAENPLGVVAAHEITHKMKRTSPDEFMKIRDLAFDMLSKRGSLEGFKSFLDTRYESSSVDEEIVAHFTELAANDASMFEEVLNIDRNLAQRLWDMLDEFVRTSWGDFKSSADEERYKKFGNVLGDFSPDELLKVRNTWGEIINNIDSKVVDNGSIKDSLNLNFERDYDNWDKNRLGGYLKLGTVSKALQSIGINPSNIYWDKNKIYDIKKKHPEMTDNVIKQVPKILESPIIVMQSLTRLNRVVIMGEVFADGKPVLCALELTPKGNINDFVKMTSAYGKNNAQNLLNQSDILYLNPDKKRTDSWLQTLRLQLPAGVTNYGPLSRVAYYNDAVNGSNSKKGKTAIELAFEKANNSADSNYMQNDRENSQRMGDEGIEKFLEYMEKSKIKSTKPRAEGEFFRRLREERNKNEVGNIADNLNNNIKERKTFKSDNISYENENKSFFSYLKELEQKYGTTDSDLLYSYLSDNERTEYERLSTEEKDWSNRALMDAFDEEEKMRIKENENELLGSMGANSEFVESTSETKNSLENSDLGQLRDRAGELQHTRSLLNKDIARVLDTVSGKSREMRDLLFKVIEKPLLIAKAKYTENIKNNAKKIHEVFNDLEIKAKSRESAAVQWLGEGVRVNQQGEKTEYTLNDLKREFPQKWQDIVNAEKFCRSMYDEYIKRINEMLSKVYPDVEEKAQLYLSKQNERATRFGLSAQIWNDRITQISKKIDAVKAEIANTRENTDKLAILKTRKLNLLNQLKNTKEKYERYIKHSNEASQKAIEQQRKIEKGEHLKNRRMPLRKDYYHHFEEIAQGLGGLKNILNTPMDIDSNLAGQSEFTKPKSKWWGAMQKRSENGSYTADALSGIAKYMTAAEYKIAFDPVIANLRATATAVANGTKNTRNANRFIEFLGEYANSIAGKTNYFDRAVQGALDRKFMKALEKINGRVKSNAVMGNLSSALVQIGNLPNAFAYIKNPVCFVKGAQETVKNRELLNKSNFLNERYMSNEIEKMTEQTILSPRKLANWIMEIGDKKAAEIIWLSARNNYISKNGNVNMFRNYENEIDYADDITRRSVGGRGVGETPISQKSRIIKFIAPFQLEVNNTYQLFKEQFGRRNALGLIEMQLVSWLINSVIEFLNGNRPLPDLIDAFGDIFKDWTKDEKKDRTVLTKFLDSAERLGGEAVSAVPYSSQLLPNFFDEQHTKAIFGENDPTRYGTGNILSNTIAKPISQLHNKQNVDLLTPASMILPPYGGKQLDRSTKALQNWGDLPKLNFNTQDGFKISKNEFPASITNDGNIRFPMEKNVSNFAKNFAFGSFATKEGKQYIEDKKKPLSEKQSEKMRQAYRAGVNPIEYYRVKNLMGKVSKNSEKYEILLKSPLNKKNREYLLNAFVTPSKTDRENIARFKVQGIPLEHYLKCKIEYGNLTEKFKDINERKTEFNKWIRLIPLSHEKQRTIKEVFKTENILDQKLDGKFVNPNAQRKFNRVKITMGINEEKFLKYYPIATDKELSQQQKINNLQDLGLSEFEALSFILQMKK